MQKVTLKGMTGSRRGAMRTNGAMVTIAAFITGCASEPIANRGSSVSPASVTLSGSMLSGSPDTHDGKTLLFGNLHAHSNLSDDIRPFDAQLAPQNAFEYARDHGLDFLALSDHHKAMNLPHRLSLSGDELELLSQVANDFNQAHSDFVAIPALEWGSTATGNHINIIGPDGLPPDSVLGAEYDELVAWAGDHAQFIQFNHPNSWKAKSNRNRNVGNFGQALFSSDDEFVASMDPVAQVVSIITTVKGGHISGEDRHSEEKVHREMQWEKYYQHYLNIGFHISPSANQDTHWRNWGTVTAARTAAWVDAVSFDGLMDGFRANRVYASEDDELAVVYQVRYNDRLHWMGETVQVDQDETDIEALVLIWQVAGSDNDPTDEGPYTVDVLSDWDGIGGRRASVWTTIENVPGGTLVSIPLTVVSGEYIYLRVTEENGKDNPLGEGEDVYTNGTDIRKPDGKRDDLNDSAWTSPIWFERPVPPVPMVAAIDDTRDRYVWSASSTVYHDPNCWAVRLIGRGQFRSGPPPAGRAKHQCATRPQYSPVGAISMTEPVVVSLVIDKRSRTKEGIEKVQSVLKALGAEPTGSGLATVSCRVSPERFRTLFGTDVEAVPPVQPGDTDFGAPGGYDAREEPSIPDELAEYVTSVSVEPPVRRLDN